MRVHRYALATVAATFLLLIAGGLVHATGSALACPDWPLCYGHFFPTMKGGVQFEHGHRLIAAAVVVLTAVLAALLWRRARESGDGPLRWLGLGAVGLVLVQAVLGGLTVIYRLPVPMSTAHLATSMLFFSLLVYITVRVWPRASRAADAPAAPRRLVGIATLALYLQIVLGALVKHTGSSLACIDVPLCAGSLWPAGVAQRLQMAHRMFAVVVAALIIASTVPAMRWARKSGARGARKLASASHLLVLLQIGLGAWSVWSFLAVHVATTHLAVGALLLADMVALYSAMGPVRVHADAPAEHAGAAAAPSGARA